MNLYFKESTDKPGDFFNILPPDWQEAIIPHWEDYQETTRIFVLSNEEEVLGGGLIFSTVSPDTVTYREEAQRWFDKGYLYVGFLWISEKHRDKKLGSKWLQELYSNYPGQKFWLTVEEFELTGFYERNGFRVIRSLDVRDGKEWLMAREALN